MKNTFSASLILAAVLALAGCSGNTATEPEMDYVTARPGSSSVSWEKNTVSIEVDAKGSYRLALTDDEGHSAGWMSADKTSASGPAVIQVTVAENPATTRRRGSVNIIGANTTAFVDITQDARPAEPEPEPEPGTVYKGYYKLPVYEEFRSPRGLDVPSGTNVFTDPDFSNITVEANRLVFDGGLVIEKTGPAGNFQMGLPIHVNPKYMAGFQLGVISTTFNDGDAWIFKIPMEEDLWGNLRFSYDSRNENITTAAPYTWSTDEGASWHPVTKMEAMKSEAACKSIWFSIPEAWKVRAGNALWIRVIPTTSSPRIQSGLALVPAEAPKSSLPAQDKETIVISEGFDAIVGANASYLDAPGFLKSHTSGVTRSAGTDNNPYAPANPAIETLHAFARPGFLQLGSYDEALVGNSGWNGSITLNVGQRLKEMGLEKADLTISFLAAGMTSVYQRPTDAKVILLRNGEVAGRVEGLKPDTFSPYSFTVKDADQNTLLTLTSEKSTKPDNGVGENPYVMADYRFFLDDILVVINK